MNNIEALLGRIVSNPGEFGLDGHPRRADLTVEVVAPRFERRAGRVLYRVFLEGASEPVVIAQSPVLWERTSEPRDPNRPPVRETDLQDLLPRPSGVIRNGERRLYWARFVPGSSLAEELRVGKGEKPLMRMFDRMEQLPWKGASGYGEESSREALGQWQLMASRVCSLLAELKEEEPGLLAEMAEGWGAQRLGFSHGDIWCNDILHTREDGLCVLDWEWVSEHRPAGTDALDLALSAIEVAYGLRQGESIVCLLNDAHPLEARLRGKIVETWRRAGHDRRAARMAILCYLIHAQHRVLLQTAYVLPSHSLNCARTLAVCLRSPGLLDPLLPDE